MPQIKDHRPINHNYREELCQRFGIRPHLCDMESLGQGSEERRPYQVEEGVAFINISGVLVSTAWWCDETSYHDIQAEVKQALSDSEVEAILLCIDSPGGETSGAFETAQALVEAGKKKPMWAVADPIAYSAGYLLAATASKIFVSPVTGGVGSIGVYSAHFDLSGMMAKMGVKVTLTSAGKGKTDGNPYEPLSDSARKNIKAEVDRLYGEFVGAISKARNISADALHTMGAKTFHGAGDAIASGLADMPGGTLDAWAALGDKVRKDREASRVTLSLNVDSSNSAGAPNVSATSPKEATNMADLTAGAADTTLTPAKPETPVDPPADPVEEQEEQEAAQAPVDPPADPPAEAAAAIPAVVTEAAAVVDPIAAARAAGIESAHADFQHVIDLCELAGQPALALGFITNKTSIADVKQTLIKARATPGSGGEEIHSTILPEAGTSMGAGGHSNTNLKDNLVVKAAEAIAAKMIAQSQKGRR